MSNNVATRKKNGRRTSRLFKDECLEEDSIRTSCQSPLVDDIIIAPFTPSYLSYLEGNRATVEFLSVLPKIPQPERIVDKEKRKRSLSREIMKTVKKAVIFIKGNKLVDNEDSENVYENDSVDESLKTEAPCKGTMDLERGRSREKKKTRRRDNSTGDSNQTPLKRKRSLSVESLKKTYTTVKRALSIVKGNISDNDEDCDYEDESYDKKTKKKPRRRDSSVSEVIKSTTSKVTETYQRLRSKEESMGLFNVKINRAIMAEKKADEVKEMDRDKKKKMTNKYDAMMKKMNQEKSRGNNAEHKLKVSINWKSMAGLGVDQQKITEVFYSSKRKPDKQTYL